MTSLPALLVDGFALGDKSRDRGIGIYLSTVLRGLEERRELDITVLTTGTAKVPDGLRRKVMRRRMPSRLSHLEHDLLLGRELRGSPAQVFWSPAQHPPRHSRVPWVQTLHDLTPLVYRDPILRRDTERWQRLAPRLRDAAAIIVPSASTARQAIEHVGVTEDRIHVIPHGVGAQFTAEGPAATFTAPYVLLVAAWGPHKGFEDALRAMEVVARHGLPHELVIAGPQDDWMQQHIDAAIEGSSVADRTRPIGWVADLAAVYRGADAFLMPSRAEGFGLPLLEAMACGTPVVSYDNTCLAEVVGDAGTLVPDGESLELGRALVELLDDPGRAAQLTERGLARAARYSWADSFADHAEVLLSVAAGDMRRPTSAQ